jgi:hypothetical protein
LLQELAAAVFNHSWLKEEIDKNDCFLFYDCICFGFHFLVFKLRLFKDKMYYYVLSYAA